MQPSLWTQPRDTHFADGSASSIQSLHTSDLGSTQHDWQGTRMDGQEQHSGGYRDQQQYEQQQAPHPPPDSTYAPYAAAQHPQQSPHHTFLRRPSAMNLNSLQPSAAASGYPHLPSPSNAVDGYGGAVSGRSYAGAPDLVGRKRAYEDSFGEGGEGDRRARRTHSGLGLPAPPNTAAYSLPPSTPGLYSAAENSSPASAPVVPFHPSPTSYYPPTSSALSQSSVQPSPVVQRSRIPSTSSAYAPTPHLSSSSLYPPSSQAPTDVYQNAYEHYQTPAVSHAPSLLANFSSAPPHSGIAYQSPQPSPALPSHILPHRFQQQPHYPSTCSPASSYQPHPAVPSHTYTPQRAFSVDAGSHPYHFPSPYPRQRSPSTGSIVAARPATSVSHASYGGSATSYAPSTSYGQATSFEYNSAPRVTSQSFGTFSSSGPSAEAVGAPSPMFPQRPPSENPASAPPAVQSFALPAQPSAYPPASAAQAEAAYRPAYAQPQEQQDWSQPSQPHQSQQEQLPPFLPEASVTGGVYYTPAPSSARPSLSSGPSPTYSSFSSHSTASSQPPPSASLPPHPPSAGPSRQPTPPQILPSTIPALQQAATARTVHRSSAPVLAFNPAREPASSAKQRVKSEFGTTYLVSSSGSSKGKAKSAEVPAACWTCQTPRAKVILRGTDLSGFAPRLSFTCLDCLPVEGETAPAEKEREKKQKEKERLERLAAKAEVADNVMLGLADEEENLPAAGANGDGSSAGRGTASPAPPPLVATGEASSSASSSSFFGGGGGDSGVVASLPSPSEHDHLTFKDSFSGAVDFLEGRPGGTSGKDGSRIALKPEETKNGLPAHLKRQALTCDVCDRIVGAGSISSLTPGPVPTFTVEVICHPCEEKYRPCSDCGGGGGRLTPGRWRCKELFPAGRRTCTLSHARNPPLDDIEYDVLRVTEIDPAKLDSLENRCRLIYFNTRLRTQARPEMLERADGLATTYAQCEKLTVDGWSLLKPMLSEDVEPARNLRRYVAIQTSTPHRRRSKPKPGAAPRPEPVEEEVVEKEISGFILFEHDFEKGAIFIAVTMPWAIAGDAFDATTVLMDELIKRVRADVHELNAARQREGFEPYPEPWCVWGITPFKAESRMTQALTRRGLEFLEDYVGNHPQTDLTCFPPHREIHIPNEFVKAFKIFIRSVTAEDGIGAPPAAVGGKVAGPKVPKTTKPRKSRAMAAR